MPTREKLEQTACEFLFELYGDVFEETETEVCETDVSGSSTQNNTELSFKDRIKKKIVEANVQKTFQEVPTRKSLQAEMSNFEITGQRGPNLEKLFKILKNIAPTSVASEQAFSIAGSFTPSRRSLLSDQSLDDLIFEKSYFNNNGY